MTSRLLLGALLCTCLVARPYAQAPADPFSVIGRAQVWMPTDTRGMDLRRGPSLPGAFARGATVSCDFVQRRTEGNSPKFICRIGPDDEAKVKYGESNGEVYGEVLATRLMWALGFGADGVYPVSVICRGCPEGLGGVPQADGSRLFAPAVIERKMPGTELVRGEHAGWSWPELDLVDEKAGGAPRAHRDALKLLAVFMQHTDSKPQQQRLLCLDGPACLKPLLMISDVGLTFGRASLTNSNALSSVNLQEWSRTVIWKGDEGCVGNLPRSLTGTLKEPVISEQGRRFLAERLAQLSDAQLRDLFTVAGVHHRAGLANPPATVDDWIRAFKQKEREIERRRCDDPWSGAAPPTFGTGTNLWLQSHASPSTTAAMNVISLLGYMSVYMALATVLAFAYRMRAGAALLLLLALTTLLTNATKVVVSFPRPDAVDQRVHALTVFRPGEAATPEASALSWALPAPVQAIIDSARIRRGPARNFDAEYGFPSGHVASSAAFVIGLALLFGWRWAWIGMLVWVPAMAVSRMYLGRHFPGDVLGGVAVAVIATAIATSGLVLPRLNDTARATRVARRTTAAAIGCAVLALGIHIPYTRDAGHLLGLALAVLLLVRYGDASNRLFDDVEVKVRVGRVILATLLFPLSYWGTSTALAITGADHAPAGALMAGAIPMFVLLAGPFYAWRLITTRRHHAPAAMRPVRP